ncbi:unnamed protein product [Durusdinium trenchii]|uniref:SH3 domain-containing protein n=1 Tax=Durusdinium trenchii TaxID=1381693 RepID=A0ABP0KRD3_9DINO
MSRLLRQPISGAASSPQIVLVGCSWCALIQYLDFLRLQRLDEVNMPSSGSCLALRPTEKVTVILRDEHYQPSPQDDWSWGFKVDEPEKEGWFPTLSYSLYIALRAESADLHNDPGVRSVKEGDILVAHVQRGKYVFGKLLPKLAL